MNTTDIHVREDGEIVDYREDIRTYQVRVGQWGVFSGDWESYIDDASGLDRYRVGYAGVLTGYWNGWCVFETTRSVVEALIARQDADRAEYATDLARAHPDWSRRRVVDDVDTRLKHLQIQGGVLHIGFSEVPGAHDMDHEIHPSPSGLYNVGLDWCWDPAHRAVCDQVHDLTADEQRHPT